MVSGYENNYQIKMLTDNRYFIVITRNQLPLLCSQHYRKNEKIYNFEKQLIHFSRKSRFTEQCEVIHSLQL